MLEAGAAATPTQLDRLAPTWIQAPVPGTAMQALARAGTADWTRMPDLDGKDIWYRCRFQCRRTGGEGGEMLRFEGLATLAAVWLNGEQILESANMFLSQEVRVAGLLRNSNDLLIRFAAMREALKKSRPRPRWRTRLVEQQQLRWMRSSLLGRIPGWTPPAPVIGPWKPVLLEAGRPLRWESTLWSSILQGDDGVVRAGWSVHGATAEVRVRSARLQVADCSAALGIRAEGEQHWRIEGELRVPGIRPWYPHTHGEPVTYPVWLHLDTSQGPMTAELGRTGFRTLWLDTTEGNFALHVNGLRVFCRGACWTPVDVLSPGTGSERLRSALVQVRDAGMNMLRVGGTMVYEDNAFYSLCDELGILVWQDWMFANMDYPVADTAFVDSVKAEARQFLQRTQLSPSLAILCGNSEIEQQAAMLGLERAVWRSPLFAEVLPAVGQSLRPDVPYWPSTPSGGALPFQVDSGSAHYFGVGAYLQPVTDARRCGLRFASECLAFANVPESPTVEAVVGPGQSPFHHPAWKARVPRDSGPGWDFEDVRDHYLAQLFRVDPMRLRYADMDRYLALSRVVTGEVMAAAFAEWRRSGSGCNGALIWFLRDLWPGAGWGLIDSTGLPKSCWYYLRRVMSPRALFILDEGANGLAVHLLNERAEPFDARLEVRLFRHGEQMLMRADREVSVAPGGHLCVGVEEMMGRFVDAGYHFRFGPPGHDVVQARLLDATGIELANAFHFPLGHDFGVKSSVGLQGELLPGDDGSFDLELRTTAFAQAVSIDAPGYRAADNYFHLAPGAAVRVRLTPDVPDNRLRVLVQALNCAERIDLMGPRRA